jgi:hypothetical protein
MADIDPHPATYGPPPRQSSGTARVIVILLVIFGVMAVICCGVVGGIGWWFSSYVQEAMSQDPKVVAAKTAELTEIVVPPPLRPQGCFDMKIPFGNQRVMLWAIYHDPGSQSMLMLGGYGPAMKDQNAAQLEAQLRASMQQQGMDDEGRIRVDRKQEKTVTIRGRKTVFTIERGSHPQSHAPRIRATGVFAGKEGLVMLQLDADAKALDDAAVDAMIESIK